MSCFDLRILYRKRLRGIVLAEVLLLGITATVIVAGCSGAPARVKPPKIDAAAAGMAALTSYDTNGDGLIAGDELSAVPAIKAAIGRIDTDGNKSVSADEVTARIQAWQETRVGLIPYIVDVTMNGKPLDGAKVVLEPEPFLGDDIKPALGTTSTMGRGALSIAEEHRQEPDLKGVQCGFYRIRVTKQDGSQVETMRGLEVAPDLPSNEFGVLDLKL